jgi:hypothetical protein
MAKQMNFELAATVRIDEKLRERAANKARAAGATQVGFTRRGVVLEQWDIETKMGGPAYFEGRGEQ